MTTGVVLRSIDEVRKKKGRDWKPNYFLATSIVVFWPAVTVVNLGYFLAKGRRDDKNE